MLRFAAEEDTLHSEGAVQALNEARCDGDAPDTNDTTPRHIAAENNDIGGSENAYGGWM